MAVLVQHALRSGTDRDNFCLDQEKRKHAKSLIHGYIKDLSEFKQEFMQYIQGIAMSHLPVEFIKKDLENFRRRFETGYLSTIKEAPFLEKNPTVQFYIFQIEKGSYVEIEKSFQERIKRCEMKVDFIKQELDSFRISLKEKLAHLIQEKDFLAVELAVKQADQKIKKDFLAVFDKEPFLKTNPFLQQSLSELEIYLEEVQAVSKAKQ